MQSLLLKESTLYTLLVIIHVIVALALILIVLLQAGSRGATLGSAFGGASQTVFGGRGAGSFLGKVTTVAAILFMLTSFTLAFLSSRGRFASVVRTPAEQSQSPSSATPVPSPEPVAPAPSTPQEEAKPSQGSGSPSSP